MLLISQANLEVFINTLIKSGKTVIAPIKTDTTTQYAPISSYAQVYLSLPFPTKSAKEFYLSDSEPILKYRLGKSDVTLSEPPAPPELVLFGLRPCEVGSYPIMNKVSTWDYQDEFYLQRRARNTVIAVSCETCDNFCFCTSVGVSPQSTEGSDILLTRLSAVPTAQAGQKDHYLAQVVTDKGQALVQAYKQFFTETSNTLAPAFAGPEPKFDNAAVRQWLEQNFDHPIWDKITLPCIGCGVCTFLCPNCHCFDIVDEANLKEGVRYKNWDACQFAMFTVHASGHNPRETQAKRFRQRIQHKFHYYPAKFGRTLCTGCGRCIRHCPADMSLLETLITIDKLAHNPERLTQNV